MRDAVCYQAYKQDDQVYKLDEIYILLLDKFTI